MQFLELSVGSIGSDCTVLHIRVRHRRVGRATVFSRPLRDIVHGGFALNLFSFRYSHSRANTVAIASREGGALVLNDFLKYIVQDRLRIVRVVDLPTDTQYVAALFNVVLQLVVVALVCHLGHLYLFTRELLVKVVKIQRRRWQFSHSWREDSSLESWHWSLELRRNESEWFVLHSTALV
jgi:hypothetical protein